MSKVVLHVGAGKTGSSALQRYLSMLNEPMQGNDVLYQYCVISNKGDLIVAPEIKLFAESSIIGYMNSASELDLESQEHFRGEFLRVKRAGVIPVFSQESWLLSSKKADIVNIFHPSTEIEIVAYVRPQIEWFNSGWWQWWAWSEKFEKPADVLDLWGNGVLWWGNHLRLWSQLPNVTRVRARLATTDIVADFLGLFGISANHQVETINQGMGADLIKFYRAIPGLRGPHGAELDTYLSRYIKGSDPSPWVVDKELGRRIVKECARSNEVLLDFLDDEQRVAMKEDARWWTEEAYASRPVTDLDQLQMGLRDAAKLLSNIILDALRRRR